MQINIVICLFVLDSEKNTNIRKNDIKKIKVLVDKTDNLPTLIFSNGDLKEQVRKKLSDIIGSNIFHLEQVFTIDYKDSIDIIYLGITNIENVNTLDNHNKFLTFEIRNQNTIIYGDNEYKYRTVEIEKYGSIEYIHNIEVEDEKIKRNLLSLLISYKRIISNIDNTDILFKFLNKTFTLEDVRIVYEMIKNTSVDKSNFRKKIVKYCEKTEEKQDGKLGYRPCQKYSFKPLKGDVWL